MRTRNLLVLVPFLLVPACSKPEPSASVPSAADQAALEKAKEAAGKLGGATKGRLTETLTRGGFKEGVEVCSAEAQDIARKVREETGARVGRSSSRLRNPKDEPPPWVGAWLKAQGERKAQGLAVVSEVVDTPTGRVAHFLKPIEIEAPCLGCHGDASAIQPEVKALLDQKYPTDHATGYALGDLRGALWAEVDVGAQGK